MKHEVRYVSDNELTDEHPWMLVIHGETVYLFLRESAVGPQVLNDVWAAFCELVQQRPALAA